MTISPEVGNDTLKVLRSPTAPLTGVTELIKTLAVNEGVSEEAAVPLFVISTTVPSVPTRSSVRTVFSPPAPKSEWKSRDTVPDLRPPTTSVYPPLAKSVTSTSVEVMTSSALATDAEMSVEFSETEFPVTTYFANLAPYA